MLAYVTPELIVTHYYTGLLLLSSGSYVFRWQSRGAIQLHGARRWAGLQSEQEHTGSGGLQSGSGQEEGETDGGERRIPPGGGVVEDVPAVRQV